MDRAQQLAFCRNCKNSILDLKEGILCGLTNQVAEFEGRCPDFNPTEAYKKDQEEQQPQVHVTRKWKCPHCDEINEENFEICWNCQAERQSDAQVIEEQTVMPSKAEEKFESQKNKGGFVRLFIEGFKMLFWVYSFGILLKSFFGWPQRVAGKLLPDEPNLMFFTLIIYDALYMAKYFSYTKEVRSHLGSEFYNEGLTVNTTLIVFYLIGVLFL